MLTGIEIAGVALAVFPLVISGLEHYEEGFQSIKEWLGFRVEFSKFLNAVCRQKIFFRQNIEALLSPIVASDYELSQLLENPGSQAWSDPELDEKLRQRLPGPMEYECYMATIKSICEVLEKLKRKLKIVDGQVHWTEKPTTSSTTSTKIRWEYQFKRISFTLGQKRRESLMNELDKYNTDFQNLIGNSERLEPMRRKRKSNVPKFFQQIREQAHTLHSALTDAWRCDCAMSHATKLLLERRTKKDKVGLKEIHDSRSTSVKFSVFFCSGSEMNVEWCTTKIMLVESSMHHGRKLSEGITSARRPSVMTDTGSSKSLDTEIMSQALSTESSKSSKLLGSASRSVSFMGSSGDSATSWALSDVYETIDLCATLKQRKKGSHFLGLVGDGPDRYFAVDLAADPKLSSGDTAGVLTLKSLLAGNTGTAGTVPILPRRARLGIAVTLANSLLQLHSGPWLPEMWGTRDIYFFHNNDGIVHTNHPSILKHFQPRGVYTIPKIPPSPIKPGQHSSPSRQASLLSLGIVILELWFNQTLEDQPFRKDFLGPDGKENEFTDFNTALKWQEMTMEEAGPDLYNPTRRCLYCAFGTASQDLEDDELRTSVYDEVVQPMERLLGRFEDISAD